MKTGFGLFFIAAGLLLLAGCASVATHPATTATAPEAQQAGEGAVIEPVPRSAMSSNHAVIALLDRAQTDSDAGQREAAGASLERALRIEPRNPWLWHELAQVRLEQGQYAQAITLARKSNSFAGHQPRVQAGNWQVIGQSRVANGDSAGAELAFKQAAEFAQQAKAEPEHRSGIFFH